MRSLSNIGSTSRVPFGDVPSRRRLEQLLLFGGALILAVVLGRSIASGQIMLAGLVGGAVLVIVLAQTAWLPYAACVALVSTFAHPSSLPEFGLPGNPTLRDLVLLAAFAAWMVVLARRDSLGPSAFPLAPQVAVGIFLVAIGVGVVVGRSNGGELALAETREVTYYATFWLALTAFGSPEQRSLLLRLGAVAAIAIVCAQVAQGFIGPGQLLFIDDPSRELLLCPSGDCTDAWAEGFPRVRPSGLVLVYMTACFAASYLLWGPRRRRRAVGAVLAVCLIGLLVSLNRNMLIGLVAGLCLTGVLATRRGRFAAVGVTAAILVIVALEVAKSSPDFAQNSIAARVLSITAVSELESSGTVSERVRENDYALDAISRSPIEGLGWDVPYGPPEFVRIDGELTTRDRQIIHNQYLGLWLRTGILGLAAFVTALCLAAVYGVRWLRQRADADDAWLGAAVVTSVTAFALSSVVAIYVIHAAWAPIVAGLLALAVNLQRELDTGDKGRQRTSPRSA